VIRVFTEVFCFPLSAKKYFCRNEITGIPALITMRAITGFYHFLKWAFSPAD